MPANLATGLEFANFSPSGINTSRKTRTGKAAEAVDFGVQSCILALLAASLFTPAMWLSGNQQQSGHWKCNCKHLGLQLARSIYEFIQPCAEKFSAAVLSAI